MEWSTIAIAVLSSSFLTAVSLELIRRLLPSKKESAEIQISFKQQMQDLETMLRKELQIEAKERRNVEKELMEFRGKYYKVLDELNRERLSNEELAKQNERYRKEIDRLTKVTKELRNEINKLTKSK